MTNDNKEEGKTLVALLYDGFVKRKGGNFVTVELKTPEGSRYIDLGIDSFLNKNPPEVGSAVRYKVILELAPDLKNDYAQDNKFKEARPNHGELEFYKLGK